jgi:hypothetical protein
VVAREVGTTPPGHERGARYPVSEALARVEACDLAIGECELERDGSNVIAADFVPIGSRTVYGLGLGAERQHATGDLGVTRLGALEGARRSTQRERKSYWPSGMNR